MEREFACIERILEDRRVQASQPSESKSQAFRERGIEAWEKSRSVRSSSKISRILTWPFTWFLPSLPKLDPQEEEERRRARAAKLERSAKERARAAESKLREFQELYADLKAPLPDPASLSDIEAQIKSTNQEIAAAALDYERTAKPFSRVTKGFDTAGFLKLSGDAAVYDDAVRQNKPINPDHPLSGKNAEVVAKAIEGVASLGTAFMDSLETTFPSLRLEDPRITAAFLGLRLYKLVLHSDQLQDKREAGVPEYLREATKWDALKLKAEVRKRRGEEDALPKVSLPEVDLFTTKHFSLPDPFSRQRRFLEEIIAELEEAAGKGTKAQPSRAEELRRKIVNEEREMERDDANLEMSEESRRRLHNNHVRKLDALHEELENLPCDN